MLGGRLGSSPVMIGRQPVLGRLRRLADSDAFALVLVNGEAGIGKTRLLRELAAATPRRVFAGQADPTALSRSLGLVNDLLGERDRGPASEPTEALDLLLGEVDDRPSIVVFEDLHWADADSVEVFERLANRRVPGMLLIGTYRTEDLSRRLPGGDMLSRLERRHDIERIHLQRLDRAEVAAFLAYVYHRPVASPVADAMFERTGGNPFFLEELAGCCQDLGPDELAAQPLPWSLEELVRRQLDGLSPEERRLAEAAAILGPSATFDVLAGVAELSEEALLPRLRNLVDRGLLVERADDHFLFRHALVRDAVEQHLLGRERRRLHQRALDLLSALPSPTLAELARHASGAGRFEEMVDLARTAAVLELRQRGTSHLALRLATDALAEAPDDEILLEVATEAAWLLGLNDEAVGWADRLLASGLASGSLGAQATAHRWLARLHFDRDDGDRSDAELKLLVELAGQPLEPIDRAKTLAGLAQATMLRGETERAVDWADQAIAAAEEIGADDVRVQAMIERGSALCAARPDAAAPLEIAIDAAEARGLWVLATRGLNNLFDAVPVHTPYGREVLERFRRAANCAGFDAMVSIVSLVRSIDLGFGTGDLELAESSLARAEEWLPLHPYKEAESVEVLRIQLALERGRTAGAVTRLRQLASSRCSIPNDHEHAMLQLAMTSAALSHDRALATELLAEFAELPLPSQPTVVVETIDRALSAGVAPSLVRHAVFERYGSDGSVFRPTRRSDNVTQIAEALLAGAEEQPEAAGLLHEALIEPDPVLTAPTLGRMWTVLAAMFLARGRRDDAITASDRATAQLQRWAGWRCDRLAEVRAELARAVPPATGSGAAGELTAREREVAALIARGLSNGDIATELYISRKTASVHVSNILGKLHLSNRTEIAMWAIRSGLAPTS